jgi:hypothetical protein
MAETLPANFRNQEDVKYGALRVVDIPAELRAHERWFNQTLTTVNDAVVRLGIFEGDFPWHKPVYCGWSAKKPAMFPFESTTKSSGRLPFAKTPV